MESSSEVSKYGIVKLEGNKELEGNKDEVNIKAVTPLQDITKYTPKIILTDQEHRMIGSGIVDILSSDGSKRYLLERGRCPSEIYGDEEDEEEI